MSHPPRSQRCPTRTHFLPLWFCSLLRIHVSRSLFFLSALVCDLLPRLLFHGRQRRIARRVSQSQFWRTLLGRTLGLFGAFPALLGGHRQSLGATFLVAREIDCGNWLALGYMPAHKHCDLSYPLDGGWGSAWVCRKLGNAPVLRSGQVLGSQVANRVLALRLVQWFNLVGWVFETQERKKERKPLSTT